MTRRSFSYETKPIRPTLALDEANDVLLATRNYKTNPIRLRALDLEHTVVWLTLFAAKVSFHRTSLRTSVPNPNFAILQIHAAMSGFFGHGVEHGGTAIGGFGAQ